MASVLTFEFRLGDKRLYESSSERLAEPVAIGSGETVAWRTPAEDTRSAPLEATLSVVRGKATLLAAEGRAFVRLGKTERKRVLAPGDRISVGDCELIVDAVERTVAKRSVFHRLEGLNGERKGELIDLAKPRFVIGSADDCDLKLPLDVISPHHAEITVEEATGIAWVRDLASRNGTSVGGTRLGDKPRMLQEGDVIGFAIWDFRFQDRNVRHVESHFVRHLVLVAVTVAIAVGAYFLMMIRTRSLDACILGARTAVHQERFDDAKALLESAKDCKDADKRKEVINTARRIITGLATVHADWTELCRLIEEGKWDEANDFSSRVPTSSAQQWEWNLEKREELLAEARLTKQRLDDFIAARRTAEDDGITMDERRAMAERLRKAGVGTPAFTNAVLPAHRMTLRRGLTRQLGRIDYLIRGLDEVNAYLMAKRRSKDIAPGEVKAFLVSRQKTATGLLRRMLGDMEECAEKLLAAIQRAVDHRTSIAALDFAFLDRPLKLPSVDECLISPVFVDLRNELVQREAQHKAVGENLRLLLSRLDPSCKEAGTDRLFGRFSDEQLWRRLLACGYWDGPLPKKEREKPVDAFDAVLGYDFFYAFMRGAPLVWPADYLQDPACLTLSFKPSIVAFAMTHEALHAADAYLSQEDVQLYVVGKLKERHERIRAELRTVEAVLGILQKLEQEGDGTRMGEMALAARIVLTRHVQRREKDVLKMRKQARARHAQVLSIMADYDPLETKAAGGIRERVFATAVPGDPAVMKARADR